MNSTDISVNLEAAGPAAETAASSQAVWRRASAMVDTPSLDAPTWSRPDVVITLVMIPVALVLCAVLGYRPNADLAAYVNTKICICAYVIVPTYLLFKLVHFFVPHRPALPDRIPVRGFFGNMMLLCAMSWIYSHVKAGVLLGWSCDEWLYQLDCWLCAGQEPWVVLRALAPERWATPMFVIYMLFYPFLVGCIFWLTLSNRLKDAGQLTCALMVGYLIGALSYHLLPSYGPAFYVASAGTEELSPACFRLQCLLWDQTSLMRSQGAAAVQPWKYIAAFPSLHVSHVLIAWWYFRRRRLGFVVTGSFAVLTLFSTTYLGWHYLADWAGGLAVAVFAIWITRRHFAAKSG